MASSSSRPRVVVPHLHLVQAVVDRLREDDVDVRYERTDGPTGYWDCLNREWEAGRSFIVLESDKRPAPGVIDELWTCPRPWCYTLAPMRASTQSAPYPSLSCVKFDASLMEAYPGLMRDVGTLDLGFGEKEWSRLDLAVSSLLTHVAEPHCHPLARVEHLHEEGV